MQTEASHARQTTLDEYADERGQRSGSAERGVSGTMVVNSAHRMLTRFREAERKDRAESSMCPSAGSSSDSLPATPSCSGASTDTAGQQGGFHTPPQEDEGGGPGGGTTEPPLVFFGTFSGSSAWDGPGLLPEGGGDLSA